MNISASDIAVTHSSTGPDGNIRVTTLNHAGCVDIQQGEFVVLIGPSGGGKSTLLKFLGGEILPEPSEMGSSKLFVPAHLRVLHASLQAMFFDGTLLSNLTFGVADGDNDGTPERVARICRKLGVTQEVLNHLDENDRHPWGSVFSTTQCQLLSIARALIANPEVLCIHQPTRLFDDVSAREVAQVLRDHVDGRGIVQMGSAASARRPRTVIMTSQPKMMLGFADRVYHVCHEKGIRLLSTAEYESVDPG